MTQQTINGTVYRVGQELKNYTEAAALLDYMKENRPAFDFYCTVKGEGEEYSIKSLEASDFPITITALPNPDPVAEDWREVHIGDFMPKELFGPEWPTQPPAFEALQLAMQEVCKADEVKLEWPEWHPENDCGYTYGDGAGKWSLNLVERFTFCFLLGGRVFVKGGV